MTPKIQRRTGPRPVLPTKPTVVTHKNSSKAVAKVQSANSQTIDQDSEAPVPSSINSSEDADARKATEVPPERSQKRDRLPNGRKSNLQRNQSDIFKSFSKSKPALKKENTDSSLAASPTTSAVDSVRLSCCDVLEILLTAGQPGSSAHEDRAFCMELLEPALTMRAEPMNDVSEDEQVDDFAIYTKQNDSVSRTDLKAQREEKLRRMMDEGRTLSR